MRSLAVIVALCLAPIVVSLPSSPAEASVVEAMSLAELAQTADVVIVARVEGQRSRYDAQGRIVTDVSLRVEESLYGRLAAGSVTQVLRLGGAVGDLGLRVEGEAVYQTGETIVLFGRWASTLEGEALRPLGMSQGVLPMRTENGVEVVSPGGAGLELVTRDGDGRLVPAPGALSAPRTRDELLDEIRSLVAERTRGR
ncbi:MAG: hypothetical protein U0353_24035 [Sandaracinus sp.]